MGTTTTTEPIALAPTSTTTTTDPLADLPEPFASPLERATHRLDIGAIANNAENEIALDDMIDRIPFYVSSYVPNNANFLRFRNSVRNTAFSSASITEDLAVTFRHEGAPSEVLETITTEIQAQLPQTIDWGPYPGLSWEVTFGRELSPRPSIRSFELESGQVAFALASPAEDAPDLFTLYVSVTERFPEVLFEDLTQPPLVEAAEQALETEWDIAEPWTIKEIMYLMSREPDANDVYQSVEAIVWFEADLDQLYESLLNSGSWFEYDEPPLVEGSFFLYSATWQLQALRQSTITDVYLSSY